MTTSVWKPGALLLLALSICVVTLGVWMLNTLKPDDARAQNESPGPAPVKGLTAGAATPQAPVLLDKVDGAGVERGPVNAEPSGTTGDDESDEQILSQEQNASSTAAARVLPEPHIAGSIRGILLREGGPWTKETVPANQTVMLDLVRASDPHDSRRGEIHAQPDANGNYALSFAFDDLTEGEYELTLSALGSWRWSPVSLRVRPPISGITFTRYDKDPRLPLAFVVSDAQTGEAIGSFQTRHVQITPSSDNGVFLHTGPLDVNAFPIDGRFSWSLWAAGYAPAFGDDTAFVRSGERRVADVRLERGWSTKVLVLARDPEARQVRGARVLVDGRSVGSTGADGMLVVKATAVPGTLAVQLDGWRPVSDPLEGYAGKTASQRGQITIVMLERE